MFSQVPVFYLVSKVRIVLLLNLLSISLKAAEFIRGNQRKGSFLLSLWSNPIHVFLPLLEPSSRERPKQHGGEVIYLSSSLSLSIIDQTWDTAEQTMQALSIVASSGRLIEPVWVTCKGAEGPTRVIQCAQEVPLPPSLSGPIP